MLQWRLWPPLLFSLLRRINRCSPIPACTAVYRTRRSHVQLELRQLSLTEETLNTAISRQADAVKASKVTIAAVETKLTAEKHKLAASVSLLSALGKKLQELVRVVDRR